MVCLGYEPRAANLKVQTELQSRNICPDEKVTVEVMPLTF